LPRTLLLALIACVAALAALADPIALDTTRVRLNAEDRAQDAVGRLRFLGGLELRSADPRFGGLSGLALGAAGRRLVAVSDAGFWFEAEIVTDDEGRLAGLDKAALWPLRGRDGAPLEGKRAGDAEAVERLGDGAYVVAFERDHRLWRYDAAAGLAQAKPFALSPPPGLDSAPDNRGLEALAVLGENRWLAITEGALDPAGDLLGWLLGYRLTAFFRPTDLAVLPSGEVVVLERSFIPPASLAARIRLIDAADIAPGARLRGAEVAHLKPPLIVDNFEGLAVHRDPRGRTVLYLVSDDNYNALQRTLLLMFELVAG
jgi:hypothetical protein